MLLIRSDGLQKPKLPAFDSWPLICQFITGESEIFSFGKTQHILRYKCPSSINKHQETELLEMWGGHAHGCRHTEGWFSVWSQLHGLRQLLRDSRVSTATYQTRTCSLGASDECMHTTHTNSKLLIHNNRCQDSIYLISLKQSLAGKARKMAESRVTVWQVNAIFQQYYITQSYHMITSSFFFLYCVFRV